MTDVVGSTDRDAHQLVLAVGAGTRHTGLDEVADRRCRVQLLQVGRRGNSRDGCGYGHLMRRVVAAQEPDGYLSTTFGRQGSVVKCFGPTVFMNFGPGEPGA